MKVCVDGGGGGRLVQRACLTSGECKKQVLQNFGGQSTEALGDVLEEVEKVGEEKGVARAKHRADSDFAEMRVRPHA